jgi:DNA-binding CsgD family transcriptional regulator
MATTADLTDRQLEAARLAAQGYTDAQIAAEMAISRSAVRQYMQTIKLKLGVAKKTQIASALAEEGLL